MKLPNLLELVLLGWILAIAVLAVFTVGVDALLRLVSGLL